MAVDMPLLFGIPPDFRAFQLDQADPDPILQAGSSSRRFVVGMDFSESFGPLVVSGRWYDVVEGRRGFSKVFRAAARSGRALITARRC